MQMKFGPGGNSESFRAAGYKSSLDMPGYLGQLGLSAYEYQCNKGVKISEKSASILGENAEKFGICLSIHSQYYISLSSVEEEKRRKSVDYIMQCMHIAKVMGADRIVVHSGSAGKISRQLALELAKDTLQKALIQADSEGYSDIHICPETMGKINQLGTLEEVIELCKLDERLIPTIDFGHLNARTMGELKKPEAFAEILSAIENDLGYDRLKVFHSHFSKIMYSAGGEVKHLTFEDTQYGPSFEPLAELVAKKNLMPRFICESAGTQTEDALKMKNMMNKVIDDESFCDERTESEYARHS